VQGGPDPGAGARARALVTRDGPRKAHVVEVSRRRTWKSADVVDMRDAVRSIECPELRPVRCEREPVGGWIRPEPWIPGEPFEVDDVELAIRPQREDPDAEQAALRHEANPLLAVGNSDGVARGRPLTREPPGVRKRERTGEPLL